MKITVFTPTFNRGYTIEKLYRSLQSQSMTDFEWLVVDDGSTDNTGALFARWQQEENPFPIRYCYQENGGKHRAINRALALAQGELFFTVDSDDYLTGDALKKIAAWEASIAGESSFCGVAGNLGTGEGETPNMPLGEPYWDGDLLARYPDSGQNKHIDGERALAIYTEIHRKYPYPEILGETFLTEAVVWNRMAADGLKMRFFDDVIWIYAYLPDGLTQTGFSLFAKNPKGYSLFLREKAEFLKQSAWKCRYGLYCDLRGMYTVTELADILDTSRAQVRLFRAIHRGLSIWKGRKRT